MNRMSRVELMMWMTGLIAVWVLLFSIITIVVKEILCGCG